MSLACAVVRCSVSLEPLPSGSTCIQSGKGAPPIPIRPAERPRRCETMPPVLLVALVFRVNLDMLRIGASNRLNGGIKRVRFCTSASAL